MADLKFKVGAAVDATWDQVFATIQAKAKKARTAIATEMGAAGKAIGKPIAAGGTEASDALAKTGTAARNAGRVLGSVADGAAERFKMLAKGLKQLPADLSIVAREAERGIARIERAQARQTLGLGGGGGRSNMPGRMGYWSMRNFSAVTPTLNMGANIARDIASGAGIDLSLQDQVQKSVERQDLATRLAIQGRKSYAADGDRNKNEVPAATLSAEAFKVGNAVGMDPNDILKAQTRFVDLTGDLATARGVMEQLGRVSNATGSDLQDMSSAAAAISVSLDASFGNDQQGKLKAMDDILRNLAAQGKEGAVEIKQYAAQMSKVAAAASELGGSRTDAFNLVGAMVQESRKRGGSTTATQAATSVAAFVRDVTKDAASKHPKLGFIKDLFQDDGHGHKTFMSSPQKIIDAAVLTSHGDPTKLRTMFPNAMSFRAVEGFAATYRAAEAEKPGSGKSALENEWKSLEGAVLSAQAVADANTEILTTSKAKAQEFNNALAQVTDHIMVEITPSLESAGPGLISAADHIGKFVAWAAQNPWQGVGAALGASVAKAGIEQALRSGIQAIFASAASVPIAIAAASIIAEVAFMDWKAEGDAKKDHDDTGNDIAVDNSLRKLNGPGALTQKDLDEAKAHADALEGTTVRERDDLSGFKSVKGFESALGAGLDAAGAPWADGADRQRDVQIKDLHKHLEALNEIRAAIERLNKSGGVRVPPGARAGSTVDHH